MKKGAKVPSLHDPEFHSKFADYVSQIRDSSDDPSMVAMRLIVATQVGTLGALCLLAGISRSDFIAVASAAWDTAHNTKDEG